MTAEIPKTASLIHSEAGLATIRTIATAVAADWGAVTAPPELAKRIVRAICCTRAGATSAEVERNLRREVPSDPVCDEVIRTLLAEQLIAETSSSPFLKSELLRWEEEGETYIATPDANIHITPERRALFDGLPSEIALRDEQRRDEADDLGWLARAGLLCAATVSPSGFAVTDPRTLVFLEVDDLTRYADIAAYDRAIQAIHDATQRDLFAPAVRVVTPVPTNPAEEILLFELLVRLKNDEVDDLSCVLRFPLEPEREESTSTFLPLLEHVLLDPVSVWLPLQSPPTRTRIDRGIAASRQLHGDLLVDAPPSVLMEDGGTALLELADVSWVLCRPARELEANGDAGASVAPLAIARSRVSSAIGETRSQLERTLTYNPAHGVREGEPDASPAAPSPPLLSKGSPTLSVAARQPFWIRRRRSLL